MLEINNNELPNLNILHYYTYSGILDQTTFLLLATDSISTNLYGISEETSKPDMKAFSFLKGDINRKLFTKSRAEEGFQ